MRRKARLGFTVASSQVRRDILVPRYYDPTIADRLAELADTHELVSIEQLIACGELSMIQGNYIGKMTYGTGSIPYIRTSDLSNWEVRGSPKHGVSDEVYMRFATKQDVREGDVLLVHEGTYLIGTVSMLTRFDTRIVLQHHLAKLRVNESARLSPALLTGLLLCPIVQRQIRTKQLTADTIDSIVGRFPEVVLPIPRSTRLRQELAAKADSIFQGRAISRARLAGALGRIDEVLTGGDAGPLRNLLIDDPGEDNTFVSLLGERSPFSSFAVRSSSVVDDILVPKYYDPKVLEGRKRLEKHCRMSSIADLVDEGLIEIGTGHEVGKLAYGSGPVPFVRTSDLGNWELKHDPKHRIAESIYEEYAPRQEVKAGDILLVRDGTYLVGTSAMVHSTDLPMLFCGGIYRLRSIDHNQLDPHLLFALLNTQFARRQYQAKRFTRDIIDTLGRRLGEVVLPLPKCQTFSHDLAAVFRALLQGRVELRERARRIGEVLEAGPRESN